MFTRHGIVIGGELTPTGMVARQETMVEPNVWLEF